LLDFAGVDGKLTEALRVSLGDFEVVVDSENGGKVGKDADIPPVGVVGSKFVGNGPTVELDTPVGSWKRNSSTNNKK